ncbi:hypothetical protein [Azohydromonas lata]|uniref:Uncharacterized protein n=1 Tax=Azohydromonas lata TaxID=45677 RepID=A0ABU5IJC8_9BURK|nr:hypothetical protein [Azohydromonas lata]MDZ5458998.1 hypothetical protein [Azohydromonas lata]
MGKEHSIRLGAQGPRERWSLDAGGADVARLDIPADAQRERHFELDCRFVVKRRTGVEDAWHELRVSVDGALRWSRRVESGEGSDSLDYRFSLQLPPGQPLRLLATTAVQGVQRVSLVWEAVEE